MDRFTTKESSRPELLGCICCQEHSNCYSNMSCDEIYNALSKLRYYEDLEEQGRLVVLPCKVGDTIYVIDWYLDCDIDAFDVCDDYRKNDEIACGYCRHNVVKKFVSERKYENQKIDDFGKTIFLTREEAEEALKRIKGE
jgi:hypothetical protein